MKIIEYFTSENQAHWLSEIKRAEWGAGQLLYELLRDGRLKETIGETALVPMLVSGDELISFCTFAPLDDIQPTDLSPWIGFVYTFPEHRGHRYSGRLIEYAESIAEIMGKEALYISTSHSGLYEKYGYEFHMTAKDIGGEPSRVYRKLLSVRDAQKEERAKKGAHNKGAIVSAARKGVNPTAYCGLSCDHCFLGEWCGGCRSVFCCCSFGTLFNKAQCPNALCCKEKSIEGCYNCDGLESCKKGFYADEVSGAKSAKAQAIFIKAHGVARLYEALDNLHKTHSFEKMQEMLGNDIPSAINILEEQIKP